MSPRASPSAIRTMRAKARTRCLRGFTRRRLDFGIYSTAAIGDRNEMNTKQLIESEVAALPKPLQREVYDFARFLRAKRDEESFNGLLLSEKALARDWNTPEEEAAWASL